METLPFRQVHLDFHTSEAIPGIAKNFSKKEFQRALKAGHINSITVFSKCHHGFAYHPSSANEMHPGLTFDLLAAQIEAAHEIGVKTPVYISAGLDEKMARRHPEWVFRAQNESTSWAPNFMSPGYHELCMNSPYLNYLLGQIDEVVQKYDADGIFLDIVGVRECYCQNCIRSIRHIGGDPTHKPTMLALWEKTYANYTSSVEKVIHGHKSGMRIFHNGGHIRKGRRDLAFMNTHLELESLPTGGWGYDHFPLSARYVHNLGMEFLGMTGKFHTAWGEFGGYKHPNALKYEVCLSIANGAKCSIGDQLHPEGIMDEATYALIGVAYKEVEDKEAWCGNVTAIADIALLSREAAGAIDPAYPDLEGGKSDVGAVRMLLEGKYLFDVIDSDEDFGKYKVIILPDHIRLNETLLHKILIFCTKGGKILATGESGMWVNKDEFAMDLGVTWIAKNPFKPDYFRPGFPLKNLGNAAFVCYTQGQKIELGSGVELGHREDPWFNREIFTFCSHQHTPTSGKNGGPAMVQGKTGIYIAWNIFNEYACKGSLFLKEIVFHALDKLLPEKILTTNLGAQGVVTLMKQAQQNRLINHLLYASPVKRGEGIEIIEDIVPVFDIQVQVRLDKKPTSVTLEPQHNTLPYIYENGMVSYTVPRLECHQMVVVGL